MKKVIVAGCGHGGLVAAADLAKAGFEVEVYEKKKREELGHDWEDRFSFSVLDETTGIKESQLPAGSWRFRGDCAFVSPAKRKRVNIHYDTLTRQKVMWRKDLINLLLCHAENNGVKLNFETEIISPVIEFGRVTGIKTDKGEIAGDMIIDAAGVFSPLRTNLPENFGIEKMPKHGDLFYGWRAYFNRLTDYETPAEPFEVYMRHEGEQGLSWFLTNETTVDVLIGRTYKLTEKKVNEQLSLFRKEHPWMGDNILHGGQYGIIPVRRPLTLMVADGYACVGDSAFMTTPMNGMGIDLSLRAGKILAETIICDSTGTCSKDVLWKYNRKFHILYGGDTAKNEGLKNAILSLKSEGVDFLFENEVIQSSDLAGAGRNMNFKALAGKFGRGMRKPPYFLEIVNGLIKGSKASSLYKNPPVEFDRKEVEKWSADIAALDIKI